jgi:uncharacterized membrane protein YkvA (DUF1232 family)
LKKILEKTKKGIKLINVQFLSLWYMLLDRRVPIYAKLFIIIPFGYILSPLDIIPDSFFFIGQIDDLAVFRFSLFFLKKIVKQNIIDETKGRAEVFLKEQNERRLRLVIVISAIWIVIFSLICVYFIKKILKHKSSLA